MEIAGIDAESIVTQLMQIERLPLTQLEARKTSAQEAASAIGRISTAVTAFSNAALNLVDLSKFDRYAATVSHGDIVGASVTGTAAAGTLTFTVDRLAQSHGLRSIGTVAADSVAVTSASFLAVAAGTRSLGIDTVRAGAGLAAGPVVVEVTQASAAAASVGTTPLAGSTTISAGSNDTLAVTVNGTAHTLTIAAGTYDADGLRAAVQDALDASGVAATATLDTTGSLELTTTREGSSASMQVTGGTALAGLGLAVDAAANVGTDGVVEVDGNVTTVTQAESGQAVAISTGAGTLDVTLSGGVRVGSKTVQVVSTGDRSLADVAAAINTSNGGVSAAAVKVADGSWRLQLSSRSTGENGRISIDSSVLDGLGGMVESSAAQNARITIGSGVGAYQVEASGNTFTDVLPGVSLTAKSVSANAVTVDVARDDAKLADDVNSLITKANALLADIKVQTRTDPTAGTKGALAGNGTIRRLADQIRSVLSLPVDGVDGGIPAAVGITIGRDGSFAFDRAKFLSAIGDDPSLVARMFARGGTSTGDAVVADATAETRSGSYVVDVTTAATQASTATLFDGGAVTSSRVGIRVGSITATYDVTAGQSVAQIVDGLNDAFVDAGLQVVAEIDGTGLRLRAQEWGSAGTFELNTDVLGAGTWDAQAGTDIAGTIDGVAATGLGRTLSLSPLAESPAAGLKIDVEGGAIGAVGTVDYQPGIAARAVELATFLTDDDDGILTSAQTAEDKRVTEFNTQIDRFEDRMVVREANLRRQWAALQTLLSDLQNQSSWLSSQLSGLSANWGGG